MKKHLITSFKFANYKKGVRISYIECCKKWHSTVHLEEHVPGHDDKVLILEAVPTGLHPERQLQVGQSSDPRVVTGADFLK
jgi:hypothetical protein